MKELTRNDNFLQHLLLLFPKQDPLQWSLENGSAILQRYSGSLRQANDKALRVQGKAKFSRSGRVAVKGQTKTVRLSGVSAANTFVVATCQEDMAGVYVRSVVPASGSFKVHLSKKPPKAVTVGWIAFGVTTCSARFAPMARPLRRCAWASAGPIVATTTSVATPFSRRSMRCGKPHPCCGARRRRHGS